MALQKARCSGFIIILPIWLLCELYLASSVVGQCTKNVVIGFSLKEYSSSKLNSTFQDQECHETANKSYEVTLEKSRSLVLISVNAGQLLSNNIAYSYGGNSLYQYRGSVKKPTMTTLEFNPPIFLKKLLIVLGPSKTNNRCLNVTLSACQQDIAPEVYYESATDAIVYEQIALKCIVRGQPYARIRWHTSEGVTLNSKYVNTNFDVNGEFHNSTLRVSKQNLSRNSLKCRERAPPCMRIICSVNYPESRNTQSVGKNLDVFPSPPEDFKVITLRPMSAFVTWKKPFGDRIMNYTSFGIALTSNRGPRRENIRVRDLGFLEFFYTISSLNPCTYYSVEISSVNYLGESVWVRSNFTTTSGLLDVKLNVKNVSSSSAKARWTLEEQMGENCQINRATMFKIWFRCTQGFSDLSNCSAWKTINANNDSRDISLRQLNPATKYEAYLFAYTTQAGYNISSSTVNFMTEDARPIGTPRNLKAASLNTTTIMISWGPIGNESTYGSILNYNVQVRQRSSQVLITSLNISRIMLNGTLINGLQECTEYAVFVNGCNSVGCGSSATVSVRTKEKPIKASFTLNVQLNEENPNQVFAKAFIAINKTEDACFTGYSVQYKKSTEGSWMQTVKTHLDQGVIIHGLEPFTTYQFRSRLEGYVRKGNWSAITYSRTSEGIPGAVRNLEVSAVSNSSANLTWQKPLKPYGVLLGYRIIIQGNRSYDVNFSQFNNFTVREELNTQIKVFLPATNYKVTVYAINSLYTGIPRTVFYETGALPPLPPTSFTLDESTVIFREVAAMAEVFPDIRRPVTEYEIIVVQRNAGVLTNITRLLSYDMAKAVNQNYYLSMKLKPFSGVTSFSIGDGKNVSGLVISPLIRRLNYTVLIRGVFYWKGQRLYSEALKKFINRYPIKSAPESALAMLERTTVIIKQIPLEAKVVYLRIIVKKVDLNERVSMPHPDDYKEKNITSYYKSKSKQLFLPYIAAELSKDIYEQSETFVIGDGTNTSRQTYTITGKKIADDNETFFNGPLDQGSSYVVFIRAYHSELVYFSSEWSSPLRTLPFQGSVTAPRVSTVGIIIGIVICVLAIPSLMFMAVLVWKKQKKRIKLHHRFSTMELLANNSWDSKSATNSSFSDDVFDLHANNAEGSNFHLKYSTELSHPPISANEFADYVDTMKEKAYALADEFQELKDTSSLLITEATKAGNAELNRDSFAVPFDDTRVRLVSEKKEASSYINAAYVDSYSKKDAYIATQTPFPSGVKDFWMMVWQQNVSTIVMLNHVHDENNAISFCYWPFNKDFVLGDLVIKNEDTIHEKCCTIRGFAIIYKKTDSRFVRHFQFNQWPVGKAPLSVMDLLHFRHLVWQWHKNKSGSQIIQCSNGSDRTGLYIAVDAILENIRRSKTIDIFNYVNYLRSRRTQMVATGSQYEFIYKAVEEILTKYDIATAMTRSNAREVQSNLLKVDPLTGCTGFRKLFRNLHQGLRHEESIAKVLEGSKAINDYKNRYTSKMPSDTFRVRLPEFGGRRPSSSDYINATNLCMSDGVHFITTQAPFGITINDFWTMVHFSQADVIVTLNELKEGPVSFSRFWPTRKTPSLVYGKYQISLLSETKPFLDVSKRQLLLSEIAYPVATKEITHFHVKGWKDHGVPASLTTVVQLCQHILENFFFMRNAPVIIQCSDGFGRSGTFCCCIETMKKLSGDGIVDIQKIVKEAKKRNVAYVDNDIQFKFIFDIALLYLSRGGTF